MRYVIIGGGIAGTTAAEEIRKRDPESFITIIESEQHRLYSRVLLPHYVEGRVPREKVFLKKPEFYEENNIEIFFGVRVKKIDLKNQFVLTSEERELPFDKLLVTTGGDLRLIEEDTRGVVYLRSLDDADQILQLVKEVKALPESERSAAIYGGGFISLEFLNIFAQHKIPTTLIMRSEGFWSRVLSKESQAVMLRHVQSRGVKVLTNEPVIDLVGEKELQGIRLHDGTRIPAKILGVGIGIKADHQLFEEAGIEYNIGVIANEYLETPQKNVYTAGDVAEFEDVIAERQVNLGNWMNAIMQARVVAKTMTGERTRFELVSSYATDFLEKDCVFVGDVNRERADNILQAVADEENAIELLERDGRTVGAVLIGDVSNRQKITNAIKSRQLYS